MSERRRKEKAVKEIALTQGKVAIVDDADFDQLSKWKWSTHCNRREGIAYFYAVRREGDRLIRMHHIVLGVEGRILVDHVQPANTLDNRRTNLRVASISQNAQNQRKQLRPTSSKFKGVSWHRGSRKWRAVIGFKGKLISLGLFHSEQDAARAYDRAAVERFGEFARPNFITERQVA